MASTSTSVTGLAGTAQLARPQKKRKRSSSTPPAPRPSQLSTHLRSRRHTWSRAASPATDVEQVPPLRSSARLARRNRPFINSRSLDIYTHLAGPNGAGSLLSEPLASSIIFSTTNETADSQPEKKSRGCRRKTVDLTDENVKKDLMEEWARMRQSQGTLPLSGIDENVLLLRDTRKSDRSVSPMQLEVISNPRSEVTVVATPRSQEVTLGVSLEDPSIRTDAENVSHAGMGASGNILGHKGSIPSLDGTVEQPVPSLEINIPSTSVLDPRMGDDVPTDESGSIPHIPHCNDNTDFQRPLGTPLSVLSAPLSPKGSAHVKYTNPTRVVNEHADAFNLADLSRPFDGSNLSLDSHEEFYMLDIPEIFSLPWVSVASHVYVPPSLGKLISGMKEQLKTEAQARRRAEELYQAELRRRISAEKIIEKLRSELEERQEGLTGGPAG